MSTLNHAFAILGWALLVVVVVALVMRSRGS
jgi:high-affinity Fe2+/Pb2+ permease